MKILKYLLSEDIKFPQGENASRGRATEFDLAATVTNSTIGDLRIITWSRLTRYCRVGAQLCDRSTEVTPGVERHSRLRVDSPSPSPVQPGLFVSPWWPGGIKGGTFRVPPDRVSFWTLVR